MNNRSKKIAIAIITGVACVLALVAVGVSEYLRAAVYDGELPYKLFLAFGGAERLFLAAAAVCLMLLTNASYSLKPRLKGGIIASTAGLAVAIANFPFLCLADGSLAPTADAGGFALFALYCLSVGLFEEAAFRGFVFPFILGMTIKKKNGVTIAVLASSAVFALIHLLNIFQGANVGATLLQVGYTFLVGSMCCVIMIATRSLAMPVLVHTLFDIGGTMTALKVATGSHWNTPSIVIMAVVSVLACAYLIYYFFKNTDRAHILLEPIRKRSSEHNE